MHAKTLGILLCDDVLPEFKCTFGCYPAMFTSLIESMGYEYSQLRFEVYDVVKCKLPKSPDECDAYLVTGSMASVYDNRIWIKKLSSFIQQLAKTQQKMLGICFGHQLIAHALGGYTRKSTKGWGVGVHTYQLRQLTPWMQPALSHFNLLVSHQDQVVKLPDNATLLAGNEFCPHSAFSIGNQFLGIQGHPEFSKAYTKALLNHQAKVIGRQRLKQAHRTLTLSTNENEVMRWMLNFCFAES